MKFSKKHIKIINTIRETGKYRPTYSDHEPATKTLLKKNIIEWLPDYSGLRLTEYGKTIQIPTP